MSHTSISHPARILSAILLALCLSAAAHAQVSFGQPSLFNEGWSFLLADEPQMAEPQFTSRQLRPVKLPHDWSIEGTLSPSLASCTGYLPGGIAWYRKTFTISDAAPLHYIYFEGVYNRSTVYLNGHLLGTRPNGYASFLYDMTPYLKDGQNVIAVRVDHSRSADSRWYTGSGIYRDVYLISAGTTRFAQWGVDWQTISLSEKQATVAIEADIEAPAGEKAKLELKTSIYDAAGRLVATKTARAKGLNARAELKIARPQLWDLKRPYLYKVQAELLRDGAVVDQTELPLGLRTFTFDPQKGFALNGQWMKVKGVCIHHDAGALGAAVPAEVWERRLWKLKEIGVNAIRMSHNPQAPALYDLCDRVGLLVMDEASDEWEFPKRKWLEGWNVGTPGFEGSFDFFEEWMETDLRDMVRRDRNHPSIFLWSIGNEVDYPNDPYSHPILDGSSINQPMFGGYKPDAPHAERIGKIAKRFAAAVRSIDPTRAVTGALAGVVMSNETEYPEAVDVVGYNYTEDRYDLDHATYPDRVIYGSENSVGYSGWKAVTERDFIFGQFLWTGIDYLGESRAWPSRGMYTGLLDFGGFLKPRGQFRASLWSETPFTYAGTYPVPAFPVRASGSDPSPSDPSALAASATAGNVSTPAASSSAGLSARTASDSPAAEAIVATPVVSTPERRAFLSPEAWDSWNFEPGQMIRVVCYTNAPFAKLLLNGSQVGAVQPYNQESGIIAWDLPYAPGELKAVGCDASGAELSSYSIQSSSRPYALRVSADKGTLKGNGSVAHLTVEVVDESGVLVRLADNSVTARIEGPAELLGLEASDNTDMTNYRDATQRVYRGRLLAYIRATAPTGTIRVHFSSPLLQGCTAEIQIR